MSERRVVIPKGAEIQYESWHLAPAIRVGDTLYCSGQIGVGADGEVPPDVETQMLTAFESLKAVLEAAGGSLADVVELTSFHVGLQRDLDTFLRVKDRYIGEPYPAQTAVGVAELGLPGLVLELRAVALLGS